RHQAQRTVSGDVWATVLEGVLGLGYVVWMQRARSSLCFLFPLVLLAGCGAEDAPSDRHEISGSVSDARSNAPIAHALVTFESDALDHAETTSDGAGQFSLQVDVREGVEYGSVRASRDG